MTGKIGESSSVIAMPAIRILQIILCLIPALAIAQGEDNSNDPDLIFDSESESAGFATIKGAWKAYEFSGEKMIRLNPEPVQQCRIEMGPSLTSYDISVSAKVLAKAKRHLKPRMGVGVFGEYGFSLRIAPARNRLELVQYGEVIAEAPCHWASSQWHYIELTMQARETHWILTGKMWASGHTKPEKPQLSHTAWPATLTHTLSGRAFLTGSPFNSLPIFYDEVKVRKNKK